MKKNLLLTISSVGLLAVTALAGCNGSKKVTYASNSEALGIEVGQLEKDVLGAYDAKYQKAAKITDSAKTKERYEAFADAEVSLIYDEGIINPWLAQNGVSATVARTVARQAGKASYGLTADKFKNVVVTTSAITKEQRKAIDEQYEKDKANFVAPEEDENGWIPLINQYSNPKLNADKSYTYAGIDFPTKSEFKTTYTKDPDKAFLNYLTNSWTYNSYHYCNMVDGLVENDKYGNIVGALADKYKVEELEDGKEKWTFHLRDDASWINNKTKAFVAKVVPDDFVASAEYVLDFSNASNTASIVYGFIDGAAAYYAASKAHAEDETKPAPDFSKVGIKADADANTISYILPESTPYFISGLTYSPFLPVNRAFLEAQGSDFGKSVDNILVNGAFTVEHTTGTSMIYTKNASYYDADHVYVDKVTRKFVPGTATSTDIRTWFENGDIDSFTVNTKDAEGWKKYITGEDGKGTQKNPASPICNPVTSYGTATYIGYFNFNRSFWEYTDSKNAKNNDEALATAKALLNKKFRLGFVYGLDVLRALKMYQPSEPYNYLMRGYTNRELVSYNGKDYADFVDDEYNKRLNLTGENKVTLTGINQGGDPIYNADKAKKLFAEAKAELLAGGLKESDFPIKIDVIGDMDVETQAFFDDMYASINENAAGVLQISVNIPATEDQDTDWGSISNNYDYSMWSGWGPDYADPNTFGHTMCIGGDMVEQFGF